MKSKNALRLQLLLGLVCWVLGSARPGLAAVTNVNVVDFAFQPAAVDINPNDQVTWTWTGSAPHSTTSNDGLWDSGVHGNGFTFTQTFNTGGSFPYFCTVHPFMTASVTVQPANVPPTITTQPRSQTVAAGLGATFSVTASGTPPLSYQWQFDGMDIPGAMSASLTVDNVQPGNAGGYTVLVTNLFGTAMSSNAVLTISGIKAPLVVQISGIGKVTPSYNGQLLEIGKTFSMTAAPGVGFAFAGWTGSTNIASRVLTFQMQSNLTFTANFVDVMRPSLTITAPSPGQRWSNAVFQVTGKASDNAAVSNVWYQINGSTPLPADGTTNWSAAINLTPGSNVVAAYAEDASGNFSPTNNRTLVYVVSDRIQLSDAGLGTFTPNYSNAFLEIGKNYKITAKPGSGYVFSNWTGGVLAAPGTVFATTNPLSFLMASNLALNASFVPNPFIPRKGTYNGLFATSVTNRDQNSSGSFTLTLTDRGTYTARLKSGNNQFSASGSFDVGGNATATLKRPGTNSLNLAMTLDLAPPPSPGRISGTVGDGVWLADLAADRAQFDARTNPAPQAAHKYTMVIMGSDQDGLPQGNGYGTVNVSPAGLVTFNGNLADGSTFVQSVPLSQGGTWPLYSSLYAGKGSAWAWMQFGTNEPPFDLYGDLSWVKPPGTKYDPAGFNGLFEADGAVYIPPTNSTQPVITLSNALVVFHGGDLLSFTNNVVLTNGNKIVNLSTNKLVTTLVLPLGKFTGNVNPPGLNRSVPIQGAILQNIKAAYGFFLGTNHSGSVELSAPTSP